MNLLHLLFSLGLLGLAKARKAAPRTAPRCALRVPGAHNRTPPGQAVRPALPQWCSSSGGQQDEQVAAQAGIPKSRSCRMEAEGAGSGGGAGPVVVLLHKRLRNAKKKLQRIQELETSGKALNAEQVRRPDHPGLESVPRSGAPHGHSAAQRVCAVQLRDCSWCRPQCVAGA